MTPPLTRQQKKKLSYRRDRRNACGERGAQSRFAIRESKDIVERVRRHNESQMLREVISARDEDEMTPIENSVRSHPTTKDRFDKMPDMPRGEMVDGKLEYRACRGMGAKKRRD